jgi:hypothetical protein
MVDFFCGSGRVAAACRSQGFRAKNWDIAQGPAYDLTDGKIQERLGRDFDSGSVIAAMLAPPCTTFGPGGNRTFKLRTQTSPWGIDSALLSDVQRERVDRGNKQLRAAFWIIRRLHANKIPWILEHPVGSFAFFTEEFASIKDEATVLDISCDQCQWGAAWRKRTRLVMGHISSDDADKLRRSCVGERGVCSRTGKPHQILQGLDPHSRKKWTSVAQAYPTASLLILPALCCLKLASGCITRERPDSVAIRDAKSASFVWAVAALQGQQTPRRVRLLRENTHRKNCREPASACTLRLPCSDGAPSLTQKRHM